MNEKTNMEISILHDMCVKNKILWSIWEIKTKATWGLVALYQTSLSNAGVDYKKHRFYS